MHRLRKAVALALLFVFALGLWGCGGAPREEEAETSLAGAPGTYSATANGHNGPITVEVTVDEGGIKDLQLAESSETPMIGGFAFDVLREQILEQQSLQVDAVAGATISSWAFLAAIKDALTEAGADLAALESREIEKPAPGQLTWETDILVVGSGMAGITAAVQAAEAGADVILVEKLGYIGGTSATNAGFIYGAGTKVQEEFGIEDSAEQYYKDLLYLTEVAKDEHIDPNLLKIMALNAPENMQWLVDRGIKFYTVDPANIHPPRSTPRIHKAEGGGSAIIETLYKLALDLGVEVYTNTPVVELLKEGDRVVGAKAEDIYGNEITIKAKGVILASGGYARDKELIKETNPKLTEYTVSNTNEGDTIKLGQQVGADIILKNSLLMHHVAYASSGIGYESYDAFYVTPEGERFVDESTYFYWRSRELRERGFEDMWTIVTESLYETYKDAIEQSIEAGKAFRADTVEELAEKINMDPAVLKKTIEDYNKMVEAGKDTAFGKPAQYLSKVKEPYIGLDMYGNLVDTTGGLRVNENSQVLDTEGRVIEGLYAAGSAAWAQTISQEYEGSGTAMIQCLTFGRIAAQHAASQL